MLCLPSFHLPSSVHPSVYVHLWTGSHCRTPAPWPTCSPTIQLTHVYIFLCLSSVCPSFSLSFLPPFFFLYPSGFQQEGIPQWAESCSGFFFPSFSLPLFSLPCSWFLSRDNLCAKIDAIYITFNPTENWINPWRELDCCNSCRFISLLKDSIGKTAVSVLYFEHNREKSELNLCCWDGGYMGLHFCSYLSS